MSDKKNDVWITGIGLVSCFGEGPDTHWEKLHASGAASAPIPRA